MKKKGEWSPNGYLFAAFRKIWRWSPERKKALKEAECKNGFTCAHCGQIFSRDGIAVDHREPVIDPVCGFVSWDSYYSRLFTTSSSLQVLCKACHGEKTKAENKQRRLARSRVKK